MGKLDGMIAAVTGGASGIGEATVRRFIAEGAEVAFADRDTARGHRVAAEITAAGGKALFVEADVGNQFACLAFIRQTLERFGRLNVLVNNAGIRMYQTVVEATAESWDEILSVNLKSYAYCAKGAIPAMRQAGGGGLSTWHRSARSSREATTSSMTPPNTPWPGLTRGLAMDHGAEGIRVNAVCPGPIFTPFHARRLQTSGKTSRPIQRRRRSQPDHAEASRNRRRGCSLHPVSWHQKDASYVTGSLLFVDGGMTAM